jgi:hypothetical protein
MKWQVKYALAKFTKDGSSTVEHVGGDIIRVMTRDQPDVLAAITDVWTVNLKIATRYQELTEGLDFLCGYRKECVWEGEAISYLEENRVGWGNFGTLNSAIMDGDANSATHKTYKFSDRLLQQYGRGTTVEREFDRVHSITLGSGTQLRIGMIADYEPTANEVRSLWERFGAVDIVWNINPSGTPPPEACEAGRELGCEVMKWNELKVRLLMA